jgi:competence protein ComGC
MKKGFTLIEMLGIIAVLAVVLLVTFPVLNNSLKTMKENQNENLIKNLKISAEAYIELNRKNYPELDNSGSTTITIEDLYDAELLKGNYQVNTSNQIIITKQENGTLEYYYVNPTKTIVYNFDYTGAAQEFNALQDGLYKIETWGAQGGEYNETYYGGKGGYSEGKINLDKNTNLYVYVGGAGYCGLGEGPIVNGGYNGGGNANTSSGTWTSRNFCSGGGSTDIRYFSETPTSSNLEWNNIEGLKSRIMVAAAGGGSAYYNTTHGKGGHSGGLIGYDGNGKGTSINNPTTEGATQTSYVFGKCNGGVTSGGGAGYYGGVSGNNWAGGSGGSSFISGHKGCDAISSSSTENNITHTGQSIHYSGLYFVGTTMIDGAGCVWTNELTNNCPGMPKPDNSGMEMGHTGNGYARITYLGSAM